MEVSVRLHASGPAPGETAPGAHCIEGWWALEPIWTLRRREKFLAHAGNRTPALQPVAIAHELSRLHDLFKLDCILYFILGLRFQ
jgi:hypothetical protein